MRRQYAGAGHGGQLGHLGRLAGPRGRARAAARSGGVARAARGVPLPLRRGAAALCVPRRVRGRAGGRLHGWAHRGQSTRRLFAMPPPRAESMARRRRASQGRGRGPRHGGFCRGAGRGARAVARAVHAAIGRSGGGHARRGCFAGGRGCEVGRVARRRRSPRPAAVEVREAAAEEARSGPRVPVCRGDGRVLCGVLQRLALATAALDDALCAVRLAEVVPRLRPSQRTVRGESGPRGERRRRGLGPRFSPFLGPKIRPAKSL
mmetsp:Transcript_28633/g.96405  ORF Transcript_28633/g.96405 Transcript_28633/m.96405 type:complete len:263 (+) Transcript_28633:421-1209(+)